MSPRILLPALLLAAASTARADEASWTLEQSWRYTLAVDEAPDAFPAFPRLTPLRLVAPGDLRDGRVPVYPVGDPGDLVWHYALLLPAGDLPRKGTLPVDDRFDWSGGGLTAKGEHALRQRGRRLQLTTRVELASTAEAAPVKAGALVVQRTFDLKQGRLLQAQWQLELRAQLPDQAPVGGRWAGRLEPGEPLDLRDPAFQRDVQAAIDRGSRWLRKQLGPRLTQYKQRNNAVAYKQGRIALPVFALLRAGVEPAELEPYVDWLRAQPLEKVYSVSLYMMVLEALSIRRQALPPLPEGRSVARYDRDPLPDADKAELQRALDWLLAVRGEGWWSYGGQLVDGVPQGPSGHDGKTVPKRGDRSNTQFAILALHTALAAGLEVPEAVWVELLDELTGAQQKDGPAVSLGDHVWAPSSPLAFDVRDAAPGSTTTRTPGGLSTEALGEALARGWSYGTVTRAAGNAYGSMSAAGLSSVAVVREGLRHVDALDATRDRDSLLALRDGLGWLVQHYDVASNPGRGDQHLHYYLYSLEKAMDLAGVERVAGHEWWREGAALLLEQQDKDGSWTGQVENTSFALLFLNRATLPAKLEIEAIGPVATGARDPALWDQVAVPEVGKVRARQVLRALLRAAGREGKQQLELAEWTLAAMDPAVAPRVLPELIALVERGPKPVRKWAEETCRGLTGSDVVADVARFAEAHETLYQHVEAGRAEAGAARAIELLRDDASPQLEAVALRALVRLGGVEAVPELIERLDAGDAERRQAVWQTLSALAGPEPPFDPRGPASQRRDQVEAWKTHWRAEGPARVQGEQVRRLIARLRQGPDPKAEQALRGIGQPAVRALIDGLREDALRARAHALLKAITKQALPADVGPWLDWWEASQGR